MRVRCTAFFFTVEFRFYEPPRETKIVREIGEFEKSVFDRGGETSFGSSFREVRKTGGS